MNDNDWRWSDTLLAAGVAAAAALFLGLAFAAYGASSIDTTKPVASAALESTPVRGNFSIAASEISALQARFPGSTSENSIPTWSTTTGQMQDTAKCFINSGTPADFNCYNTTGNFELISGSATNPILRAKNISGSTAETASFIGTDGSDWTWGAGANLVADLAGSAAFEVSDIGVVIQTNGVSTDVVYINGQTMVLGDLLQIDNEGTNRVKIPASGSATFTASSDSPVISAVQSSTGSVLSLATDTTGDDPTEITKQARVATTDATLTTILTIPIATSNVMQVEARIIGRVTGGAGGNAGTGATYIIADGFKNVSGTVTRITGSAASAIHSKEYAAGLDAQLNISTTNIVVQVLGAATDNITWHVNATYSAVGS